MIYNKSVTEIILLAGNSTRFGKNINKNFEILENNKTVLSYSLNSFNANQYIVICTTNRNNTFVIQTPQCFDRNTLC